jgi:hypothetical protein
MRFWQSSFWRRPLVRETGVFLVFGLLTVVMTWPFAYYLRDAVTDPGDTYLNAWIMWWDYHQTFHDPLHLFQAPIFYPYQYTLALSEHNYGLALPLFPLFALGLRPLTVHAIATLLGFAFSGYGAFRLARALHGSTLAAWVTGLAFAFMPYRFHQMPHVNYLFSGWIPLLLEALVLFARERSGNRAVWLGLAFVMNALTCVHWFVLTLVPLAVSTVVLTIRYRLWRETAFWWRGGLAVGVALLALLPFFIPYQRVAQMYGMVRQASDAAAFSAQPADWLTPPLRNKLWQSLNPTPEEPIERALFPGLLLPLLALAAVAGRRQKDAIAPHTAPRWLLWGLNALALGLLALVALAVVYDTFRLTLFGWQILKVTHPARSLLLLASTLTVRAWLTGQWRRGLAWLTETEARAHAILWLVLGFCGSLGMNFIFHRLLFDYVFVFHSIRVPARWAMIALVGLTLLAGVGAERLARAVAQRQPRLPAGALVLALCALMLFEMRAAPVEMERGQTDPDEVALFFKETPMRGGVAHLPAQQGLLQHRYTLRQADHQKPLITAFSGFYPPLAMEINELSQQNPVPERLLEALEAAPASYLVIHWYAIPEGRRDPLQVFINEAVRADRLRLVRSFPVSYSREDIYALTRNEPDAR